MFNDSPEASLRDLKARLDRFRSSHSSSILEEQDSLQEREEAERKEKEFDKISNLFNTLDTDRKHYRWVVRHLESLGIPKTIGKVVRGFLDWGWERLSTLSGWWRYLYDHGFRRAEMSKVFYNAKEELQAYSIGKTKLGNEDLVYVAYYCSHRACAKIIKARSLEVSRSGTTRTYLPTAALFKRTIAEYIFSNPDQHLRKGDLECAIMFKVPKSNILVEVQAGRIVEMLGNSLGSKIKIGVAKDPDHEYVKIKLETSVAGMRKMITNLELVTEALKLDLQKMEQKEARKKTRNKKRSNSRKGSDNFDGTEV